MSSIPQVIIIIKFHLFPLFQVVISFLSISTDTKCRLFLPRCWRIIRFLTTRSSKKPVNLWLPSLTVITLDLITDSIAPSRQISPHLAGSSTANEPLNALAVQIWSKLVWKRSSKDSNQKDTTSGFKVISIFNKISNRKNVIHSFL